MNTTSYKTFLLLFVITSIANAATTAPVILPLWPDGVPNALVQDNREKLTVREDGDHHFSQVTQPLVEVYLAEGDHPAPAVIICPGGAYRILSYTKEGTDVARFLASYGITGIVLKYRLPNSEYQPDPSIAPLQDTQRALQLARQHADDWNIDPQKIGIMGFSAGGHLASTTAHQWKEPVIEGVTPEAVRPDFSVLLYPVISFSKEYSVHSASRRFLFGDDFTKEKCIKYSAEEQVDARTPPAFLVHSFNDPAVPIQNSINYAMALRDHGIVCEAHFYQIGGHGYGMRPGHTDAWPKELVKWIRLNFGD